MVATTTPAQLLTQLKDLHLPAAITLWPPAPGWFIVIGLLLLAGLGFALFKYRQYQRFYFQRSALQQLELLKQQYLNKEFTSLSCLSVLIRRVNLYYYPRTEVAGLAGEDWLKFLDAKGLSDQFTQGVGRYLLTAPYQALCTEDLTALFDLLAQWIRVADKERKHA